MAGSHRDAIVLGVDVGSTTVKAVALSPTTMEVLWSDYQRHQTKQPEKVLEMLTAIEAAFPDSPKTDWRVFMTWFRRRSAVCRRRRQVRARSKRRSPWRSSGCTPTSGSVIELGGQDAKIIIFKSARESLATRRRARPRCRR
jgi:hypothetical protein